VNFDAPANVIGLDLGQQSDYSALALLRYNWTECSPKGPQFFCRLPPDRRQYQIPTLKRWPLGTPYVHIVKSLIAFTKLPIFNGAAPLIVVDATGVGQAVYEMFFDMLGRSGLPGSACAVTITGGSAVTMPASGRWHVAKKALVSVLQVLLGTGRLHVAPALQEAKTLLHELGTFKVKVTEAKNESFEAWREKDHDDLVLAVALACWGAETIAWPQLPEPPLPRTVYV
jgi:hypothetical protein